MTTQDLEQRLTDLEIKLGFMEDLVDSLNSVVVKQQHAIDLLVREVQGLRHEQAQSQQPGAFRSLRDEIPPHY